MSRLKRRYERLAALTRLGYRIDRVEHGRKHTKAFVTAPDGRRTMFTLATDTNPRMPLHFAAQARRFLRVEKVVNPGLPRSCPLRYGG
jgi:hypothetical protein